MGEADAPGQADHADAGQGSEVLIKYQVYEPRLARLLHTLRVRDPANKLQMYDGKQLMQLLSGLERLSANAQHWTLLTDAGELLLKKQLAFTLFAPAGRADRAYQGVLDLAARDMLRWGPSAAAIKKVIKSLVRFPEQKARRLYDAMRNWNEMYTILHSFMSDPVPPKLHEIHDWLIENVNGFNRKAAAHFMRNAGLADYRDTAGIPIVDVHIYKALRALNFEADTYKQAEQSSSALAQLVDLPPVVMDAALWCSYSGNWGNAAMDFSNFAEDGKS